MTTAAQQYTARTSFWRGEHEKEAASANFKGQPEVELEEFTEPQNVGVIIRTNHIRDDVVADQSEEETNTIDINQSACIMPMIISITTECWAPIILEMTRKLTNQ